MQKDTLAPLERHENNPPGADHKTRAGHARQLRYDPRGRQTKAGQCSRPRTVLLNAISESTEGIGTACVALLAEAGHRVVVVMASPGVSQTLADAVAAGQVATLQQAPDIRPAIKALALPFRSVDAVVDILPLQSRRDSLLDAGAPLEEQHPAAGIVSLLSATRAALHGMLASGRGHVITVTLRAGPAHRIANDTHADALQSELDDLGIRFTRIVAGPVEARGRADIQGNWPRSNGIPRGELAAADIAQAVAWALAQPDHVAVQDIVLSPAPRGQPALSPREREVLEWTACGKTSEEIACILDLSVSAVNFHVKNLLCKLQCCNKTAAVARAALLGMLS